MELLHVLSEIIKPNTIIAIYTDNRADLDLTVFI